MGRKLDEDELIQRWTIVGDELAQVAGKRGATRLGVTTTYCSPVTRYFGVE
jgi:hypothetical protein